MNYQFDTYHTLLEARLVAGSKLTRDMSHPPTSYKEGVSFPGKNKQQEREAKSVHRNDKQRVTLSVGIISLDYMFTCRGIGWLWLNYCVHLS